jgi:hypothetical protein
MKCYICDSNISNPTLHPITGAFEPCSKCINASKEHDLIDSVENCEEIVFDDESIDALVGVSPINNE